MGTLMFWFLACRLNARAYWVSRSFVLDAIQDHVCTASLSPAACLCRSFSSVSSFVVIAPAAAKSPDSYSSPLFVARTAGSVRMSCNPPALTATTGTPLAIASITTNPSVSLSDGITNTSRLAYAAARSSPVIIPMNVVRVPSKCFSSLARSGPSPMRARLVSGGQLARMSLRSARFFSAPSRPTQPITLPSRPPHSLACISSLLNRGLNCTVSTPFCHTIKRGHPWSSSSSCRMDEVTMVRSDLLVQKRMKSHIGFTRPLQVYRGM
mmetsp:Transcript_12522/g.53820  ORF Transcript_12522/g.53820 Transcript_12522/m.53820 type:complete len:267 (+) Transcript_12522:1022-1822(+)